VPYVGSGVLASAAAMDKTVARVLLSAAGIAVTPAVTVRSAAWAQDPAAITERCGRLGLPVFVKPARAAPASASAR
jgi:D-alanine-D-alanine ligase